MRKLAWAIFFLRLIHRFRNSFFILLLLVILAFSFVERAEAVLAIPFEKSLFDFTGNYSISFPAERIAVSPFEILQELNSVQTHSASFIRPSAAPKQLQKIENELMCLRSIYQSV